MAYTDILYDKKNGVAWITINRPEVRNAFRTTTVAELTDAFLDARWDPAVGVVVLTGAGDKAFCSGGDQKERGQGGYAPGAAGAAGAAASRPFNRPMDVEALHSAIRPGRGGSGGRSGEPTLHPSDGRRGAAQRDPPHPEAGHRDGERLRDRRRPRAARALRPLDRVRQRDLRPDRAARRQRGRGPRHRVPRQGRRREEGARDLVPLPPVLGTGSPRDRARQ